MFPSDTQTDDSSRCQICFSSWLACDISFPQKRSEFHGKPICLTCVWKAEKSPVRCRALPHYYSKCCLSQQTKALDGSQEPQHSNLSLAHVFLHMKGSSLWKGLLSGENKLLSLCGSLFNIQHGGFQWVSWEIRVPSALCTATGICWDTHHIRNLERWSSCSSSLAAPFHQGWEGARLVCVRPCGVNSYIATLSKLEGDS